MYVCMYLRAGAHSGAAAQGEGDADACRAESLPQGSVPQSALRSTVTHSRDRTSQTPPKWAFSCRCRSHTHRVPPALPRCPSANGQLRMKTRLPCTRGHGWRENGTDRAGENVSDKGLLSITQKCMPQLNNENHPIKKWAKDLNRPFSKEDTHAANSHVERCSTPLLLGLPQRDATEHRLVIVRKTNRKSRVLARGWGRGRPHGKRPGGPRLLGHRAAVPHPHRPRHSSQPLKGGNSSRVHQQTKGQWGLSVHWTISLNGRTR